MKQLSLSLACQNTDRTRALIDGRIGVDGAALTYVASEPEEIFQRAFRHGEFDIAELSLSTHLLTTARGEARYVAIPAFVSRAFRHSAIYIRTDRGIASPQDLKGRKVGVPDFQQTAGVWVRGLLTDEYGVKPTDVQWHTGGLEETGRTARVGLDLPPEISVTPIGPADTLSRMLADGRLDAVIAPRAPSCFDAGSNTVARLFPDYRAAEEAYYRKAGLFPIMHVIGIRRDLAEREPWLALNVFKAFARAKQIATQELATLGYLRVTLPWVGDDIRRVQDVMGKDYWRYGVKDNAKELAAIVRYARADGLIQRQVESGEIFAPSTCDELRF